MNKKMNNLKTLPFQVSQRIVDLTIADDELTKRFNAERKASHKNLWDEIHKEYPELDNDAGYTLRCEYAEQGVVMLDIGGKPTKHELGQLLKHMLKGKL